MTPEGKVKAAVDELLTEFGLISAGKSATATDANTGWYFKPVSNGMGVHGIPDYLGNYNSLFFAIETKVEGKDPTALQAHQLNAIALSGGQIFVVRGRDDLANLRSWLQLHKI